jgi:hypothetical protein
VTVVQSLEERGRAFRAGYRVAKTQMQGELERTKQAIAADVEALHSEMLRLAADLANARCEIERLRTLVAAETPSQRLH